ncbi:MAG: hypothetical protein IKW44_04375 [Bacteroidaceae bacterium]|nr:hypothetical protein [Bacteroidaceae bacterium]
MKPTKNKIYCNDIKRIKMLFPTKEKADNFIKFNAEEIAENNKNVPTRSYYCPSCGGWHVTHIADKERYARVDNIQDCVYRLSRFITAIKRKFVKSEWRTWKAELENAQVWVAELENLPQYNIMVNEAKKQIRHYSNEIKYAEKKEIREQNTLFMKVDAERKAIMDAIGDRMDELDWEGTVSEIHRLDILMQSPEFGFSTQRIVNSCVEMTSLLLNTELVELMKDMSGVFKKLKGKTAYMPADELKTYVSFLEEGLKKLETMQVPGAFIHPVRQRICKLRKTVKNRGTDCVDKETGLDKAVLTLKRHYESVRKGLIEAITALQNQDNDLALEFLEAADGRMKALPLSREKVELMKHFADIAGKVELGD